MADLLSDEGIDAETTSSSQIQISASAAPSTSSRLKAKIAGMWSSAVPRCPSVLPIARELFMLVLRTNLMFFYFEGLYYHFFKRASGIRYVFIGRPTNQRYQILGVFLLVQLCIIAAEGLRRSNLSSLATSIQPTSLGTYQTSAGRSSPVLIEDGHQIAEDSGQSSLVSELTSTSESQVSGVSKCTHCLSNRLSPMATPCGHVAQSAWMNASFIS